MSRIEELPDDFDTSIDLNKPPPPPSPIDKLTITPAMLTEAAARAASSSHPFPTPNGTAGPSQFPQKQHTADSLLAELNKTPLFMTTLDETGEDDVSENTALEAIKALAYEGTRAEVAANFREQGNEQARVKRWWDAREFYNKALVAVRGPKRVVPRDEDAVKLGEEEEQREPEVDVVEVDEVEESRREREIEEACLVNRALCNLELGNYRSCNLDCAAALRMSPRNVKAWFRAASACLALDKIAEAEDACRGGLEVDEKNVALLKLREKINKRKEYIARVNKEREERENRKRAEENTLKLALQARKVATRTTAHAPDMEDAVIKLENPLDASSTLSYPVMLLYPLSAQSDFIKAFSEHESLNDHLSYILPTPWDERGEYTPDNVECYAETISGGLVKAGRKLSLHNILGSGKIPVVDGLLKFTVVPKQRASEWIEDFKKRRVP